MVPEEHPSWKILDSSKLDTFTQCNRKFFFEYILGWRLDIPAHDLHFGESWHKAREHQLIHGYKDIEGAYNAFITEYRKKFEPETDSIYRPKDPTGAMNALIALSNNYSLDLYENEVVELDGKKMTEISGTVPIDNGRVLHYRMDSIMRRHSDGKIFSWDHKTTHEKWLHGRQWAESFHLGIQNGTYTHCLYCMFPIEEVLGVEFYGVGFNYLLRGSKERSAGYHASFRKVPAFKTPEQMNVWLWNINDIYDDVEREMERLDRCKEGDTVMTAFQQRPHSCTAYRGCPYHDFCLSWSNPLQQCYEPPLGFRLKFWDPRDMKTSNKKELKWSF